MARRWLPAILIVSLALRLWLAACGGQYYWTDETRFGSARAAADDIFGGRWSGASRELFGHADHLLFRPACLPAALLERLIGGEHRVLVSCYFSLFSVGAILLVWAVARRLGGSEDEALWGAFLAATANCLFLYSRHYLPYDIALFMLLGALWLAAGPSSFGRSLAVGCTVGVGVMVYNGYWVLGATVLALHACMGGCARRGPLARSLGAACGLALSVGAGTGIGMLFSRDLVSSVRRFAGSVRQGDFHVGYRVIPEYLWSAEHGMLLVWLAALAYSSYAAFRSGRAGRLGLWLWGLALVAGGLVLFSDVIPRFVVYGRLTRQLAPFACLGAGAGIAEFLAAWRGPRRPLSVATCLVVGLLAAWNFASTLRLVFPDEFLALATREIARQSAATTGFYEILYAGPLWGRQIGTEIPPHAVLLRRPNPMEFRPYQFEGYTAERREQMNRSDISMRVIRFPFHPSGPARLWDGYPGPVSLTVRFSPDAVGESEPLVASGVTGDGDLVLVHYVDAGHVQFGLDHWGSHEFLSEPIAADLSRPHELSISAGSLLPPPGSPCYGAHPEFAAMRDCLLVSLDGQVVLSARAEFYGSTPSTICFGANVIGASTTGPTFSGAVSDFGPARVDRLLAAVPANAGRVVLLRRPPEWRGAMGPLRMQFRMPAGAAGQPLLSLGGPASGAVIYAIRDGQGGVRIGLDRRDGPPLLSGPIPLSAGGVQVLDVCLGSMLPGAGAAVYARSPGLAGFRERIDVRINGVPALQAGGHFQPVPADQIAPWANTVGSALCLEAFKGDIVAIDGTGPENLLPLGTRLSELLTNPDAGWAGFTGPIRMRLRLPAGRDGHAEPLLVCGAAASSDVLSVRYEAAGRVRFEFRRPGGPRALSLPMEVEPGEAHDLFVTVGSLMPPEGSAAYEKEPELARFRSIAAVVLDGRPALFLECPPHPAERDAICVASDPLGVGQTEPAFTGSLEALSRAVPGDFLEAASVGRWLARPGWGGYPGPIQMNVVFPAAPDIRGQPILTSGFPGGGDMLFLLAGADGTARIVEDHWGEPLLRSDPFPFIPGSEHMLVVSLGALFPPEADPLYAREPSMAALRRTVCVEMDGRRILMASRPCHPTPPGRITVGASYIGGSFTGSIFAGRISGLALAPLGAPAP